MPFRGILIAIPIGFLLWIPIIGILRRVWP